MSVLPTKTEQLILELLTRSEMYGLELVQASDGRLKRGTVYVLLDRLEDKGFITSKEKDGRRRYTIKGEGRRSLMASTQAQAILASPLGALS